MSDDQNQPSTPMPHKATSTKRAAPAKAVAIHKTKTSSGGGAAIAKRKQAKASGKDHSALKTAIAALDGAGDTEGKTQALKKVVRIWSRHARIEDEELFPLLKEHTLAKEFIRAAEVEHDLGRILISELCAREPDDDYFDTLVHEFRSLAERAIAREGKATKSALSQAKTAGLDTSAYEQARFSLSAGIEDENAEDEAFDTPRPRILRAWDRSDQQEYTSMADNRMRDERGRFTDDDRSRSSRRSDDGDDRRSSRGRSSQSEGSGWYGDSRGHAEAAYRGWETRRGYDDDEDDDRRSRGSRSGRGRDDDDDNRSGRRHGQGGWFGDSEGHSRAARGDDRRSSMRDDDDYGGNRRRSQDYDDDGGRRSSRGSDYDEDDGRRQARSGRDDDSRSSSRGRGHGGWFGDSEGHAEASRRGWSDRRDDDDDDRRSSRRR